MLFRSRRLVPGTGRIHTLVEVSQLLLVLLVFAARSDSESVGWMDPVHGRYTSKAKRRRLSLAAASGSTTDTEGSIVVDGAAVVRTYFRMPGMGKAKSVLLARFTGATEETRSPFVVAALLGSGSFKTRRRTETSTSAPPWKDTRLS